MCTNFDLISVKFLSTKMLTQGPSSPLKFSFLHLISYTQSLPFLKMAKVICCRVKSTRLCFEFRRLHNDFLPRVWGRGRNRTMTEVPWKASRGSLDSLLTSRHILAMIFLTTLFIAVFKAYLSGPTTSTQSTVYTNLCLGSHTKLRLLPMVFVLILTAVFVQ